MRTGTVTRNGATNSVSESVYAIAIGVRAGANQMSRRRGVGGNLRLVRTRAVVGDVIGANQFQAFGTFRRFGATMADQATFGVLDVGMGVAEFFAFVARVIGLGVFNAPIYGYSARFARFAARVVAPSWTLQGWRCAQAIFFLESWNALASFTLAS